MTQSIGIIGAGAFGTALAIAYAANGMNVTLWVRREEQAQNIRSTGMNSTYLPDIVLPPTIRLTTSLSALAACDIWLLTTPAQATRAMVTDLRKAVPEPKPLILCCKGIEISSQNLLHDVVKSVWPKCSVAILSGPTFATDIARQRPCAMTLACDSDIAPFLMNTLPLPTLRLYNTQDKIGTAVGGAVKNVLAIACGILDGMQMGDSTRAALITRGLAEMSRLTIALGGNRDTLFGLCGVGDVMLTCTSPQSRNYSLGQRLGAGETMSDILGARTSVTEGVHTAKALFNIAIRLSVDMPIMQVTYNVLEERFTPYQALSALLSRPHQLREGI